MVEKAGHKTSMHKMRMDWINEGKPKPADRDTPEPAEELAAPAEPPRLAPIFEKRATNRPTTPSRDDPFADVDIYGATPDASRGRPQSTLVTRGVGGEPDDDELDALMAEAEAAQAEPTPAPGASIFGSGKPATKASAPPGAFDEDDLDAFMAEAEAYQEEARKKTAIRPAAASAAVSAEDDLDALIAEAEAAEAGPAPPKPQAEKAPPADDVSAEEEAAMAEMDGLW